MSIDFAKAAPAAYMIAVRVLCMIIAVIILVAGAGFFVSEVLFSLRTGTATATVESDLKPIIVGGRRTRHREVAFDYSYEVDGKTYASSGSTIEEPGETVTIYYDRAAPERSRTKPASVLLSLGALLMGLFMTLYAFDPFKWFWRAPSIHEEVEAEMQARRRLRGE